MVILLLLFLPALGGNIKVDLHYWLRNIFGVNTFCSTILPLYTESMCVYISFIYLYISNCINCMGVTSQHSSPYNNVMLYKNKQLNLYYFYKLLFQWLICTTFIINISFISVMLPLKQRQVVSVESQVFIWSL